MGVKKSVAVLLLALVAAGVTAEEGAKGELAFTSRPVIVAFAGEPYEYAPQVAGAEEPTYRLDDRTHGYNIINHAIYHIHRALIERGVIEDVPR